MRIVTYMDDQGGFTVGDRDSRLTSYAYPSSTHATKAKKNPEMVALEMLTKESNMAWARKEFQGVADYDARHWETLNKHGIDLTK